MNKLVFSLAVGLLASCTSVDSNMVDEENLSAVYLIEQSQAGVKVDASVNQGSVLELMAGLGDTLNLVEGDKLELTAPVELALVKEEGKILDDANYIAT